MRRFLITIIMAVVMVSFVGVYQISAQVLKIGIFDVQKVMRESKTIEGYRQELMKQIESKQKPLRDKEEAVRSAEEKLRKDGEKMSLNERRTLEDKLGSDAKDLRRLREDFEIEVRKLDTGVAQRALGTISGVINNLAEKEGYTIVFEKNAAGVVYMKDTVDITNKILQQIK